MYEPSAFFLHDCFKRSVLKSRPIFIELYFKIQGNSNSTGTLVSLFWKTCQNYEYYRVYYVFRSNRYNSYNKIYQ